MLMLSQFWLAKSTLLISIVTMLTRHIYRHWYLSCRYDAFLQMLQSCLYWNVSWRGILRKLPKGFFCHFNEIQCTRMKYSAIFVILSLWNIKTRCFDFCCSEKCLLVVRLLTIEWINYFPVIQARDYSSTKCSHVYY